MALFASPTWGADGILVVFQFCGALLALFVGCVTYLTLYIRWRRKKNRQLGVKYELASTITNSAPAGVTRGQTSSPVPTTFLNRNSTNFLISLAVATIFAAIPGLLSICAFFAAFFSRTTAKVFGYVSLAINSLYLLFILSLNSWSFEEVLDLLLSPVEIPLIGLIELSIIFSLVAVFVPLRS